ncbi:PBSX family phage terminase large subunit [Methyloceanibacter caenitepidi]|uniref:Phage terminase large subunit n=1 Tax=Methyloceanibacter caenitepidi TaxID=1384459 RepID=A0A0A8K745_9HYPH|nr:PBSX family phage terminase large subunit [Methyloceanibacter caenitepidi]BAQ18327.1 phage terminase large subunit [Methyloceanibacter caenitepidi]
MEAVRSHQRIVCAREVQNSIADSVKQLIEDKIEFFGLRGAFKVTDTEIVYPANDSLFVFKGLRKHTVSTVKSMEGFTRLWMEEAHSISQKSLDVAIPTFRVPGSEVWASWNPETEKDPVEKLFREGEDDDNFVCIEANYWDNPWFADPLKSDMERDKRRDPDKYAHVWCGQYARSSEARVFSNWKVEEFETPDDATFYFGADWGFSIDPTVLIRVHLKGRTLFVDREAYKVGCPIDRTPDLFDKIDPDKPGMARNWTIRADSARPETIDYMRRHGYPKITKSIKGAGSVMDGIEFLKSQDIVVHPRCEKTINELSMYSWKTDPLTNEVIPVLEDKDNHVIDALRYALEGVRRQPAAPVFGTYGNYA